MKRLSSILLLGLTACGYGNPHGSQSMAPVTRISTDPNGATLFVPRLNLTYNTPCDVNENLDDDDTIVITKDGYRTWRGQVRQLRQVSAGMYQVTLERAQ